MRTRPSRLLRLPRNTAARHLTLALLAGIVLFLLTRTLSPFAVTELGSVAYYLPAVAGLTLLTGLNGQISLGHGALMMIGTYTVALMLEHDSSLGFVFVAVVLAVLVTAAVGVLVGTAAARLRGPYLAAATLALAVGLPAVTNKYSGTLGGDNGLIINTPLGPAGLNLDPLVFVSLIAMLAALVAMVLLANITRSKVGRDFRAVRDDEVAAALCGLSVARTQVLAFVISSACAGLAGAMFALVIGLAAPTAFTLLLSLSLVIAVVLGGLGSLTGAVWGALALVYVPKYSLDLATNVFSLDPSRGSYMAYAVYGVVLIVVALLAPMGIQGGLRLLRHTVVSRTGRRRALPSAP